MIKASLILKSSSCLPSQGHRNCFFENLPKRPSWWKHGSVSCMDFISSSIIVNVCLPLWRPPVPPTACNITLAGGGGTNAPNTSPETPPGSSAKPTLWIHPCYLRGGGIGCEICGDSGGRLLPWWARLTHITRWKPGPRPCPPARSNEEDLPAHSGRAWALI